MIYNLDGSVKIFGHEAVQKRLNKLTPRNIFIYGPHSVGKKSLMRKYIIDNQLTDVLDFGIVSKDNIEQIQKESQHTSNGLRVIQISLSTLNTKITEKLLKIIEDAPASTIFFCSSGYTPKITLTSRFSIFKVGYLSDADVSLILMNLGYSAERAAELADLKLGTVKGTIQYGKYSEYKPKVLEAISYIMSGDVTSMDSLYSIWDDGHTKFIRDVAIEKMTGRYRLVEEAEVLELTKRTAMRILMKVDPYDRARYIPRSILAAIARENMN